MKYRQTKIVLEITPVVTTELTTTSNLNFKFWENI